MKQFWINVRRSFVKTVIRVYTKIMYRVKVVGRENIPLEGPVIYCGNHKTYLDPQLIVVTAKRHVRFLAKDELSKNPLFNALGNLFDVIRVKRDSKEYDSLVDELYISAIQNPFYRNAIKKCPLPIIHAIGEETKEETVFTRYEFERMLNCLHDFLNK